MMLNRQELWKHRIITSEPIPAPRGRIAMPNALNHRFLLLLYLHATRLWIRSVPALSGIEAQRCALRSARNWSVPNPKGPAVLIASPNTRGIPWSVSGGSTSGCAIFSTRRCPLGIPWSVSGGSTSGCAIFSTRRCPLRVLHHWAPVMR